MISAVPAMPVPIPVGPAPTGIVATTVFVAVAIAFLLNTSSYYGEIFRAGIESIPRGQFEAARSLGLSRLQVMRFVVVPQAVKNVLPDLIGNTLEVVKLANGGTNSSIGASSSSGVSRCAAPPLSTTRGCSWPAACLLRCMRSTACVEFSKDSRSRATALASSRRSTKPSTTRTSMLLWSSVRNQAAHRPAPSSSF